MADITQNAVPEQVERIVAEELDGSRALLIASEPGRGRNATLISTLEQQFPNKHVLIGAMAMGMDYELVGVADELERARVVAIDGLSFAHSWVRPTLLELIATGHTPELLVKFQPSRAVTVRDDVVFILSEPRVQADAAEAMLKPLFPDGGFRRFDLVT